jgi:hypothetical protein
MARGEQEYIRTYTGKKCWPVDPRIEDIDIKDIAHALSLLCRFTGHVREFYSVGDHSLRVSELCSTENKLWGLLHDASEAYLVDLARPVKRTPEFGVPYRAVEGRLMKCICEKFNLSEGEPPEVKEADNRLLRTEQRDLMPVPNDGPLTDNDRWKDGFKPLKDKIVPRTSKEVEALFLAQYNLLILPQTNSTVPSNQSSKDL